MFTAGMADSVLIVSHKPLLTLCSKASEPDIDINTRVTVWSNSILQYSPSAAKTNTACWSLKRGQLTGTSLDDTNLPSHRWDQAYLLTYIYCSEDSYLFSTPILSLKSKPRPYGDKESVTGICIYIVFASEEGADTVMNCYTFIFLLFLVFTLLNYNALKKSVIKHMLRIISTDNTTL